MKPLVYLVLLLLCPYISAQQEIHLCNKKNICVLELKDTGEPVSIPYQFKHKDKLRATNISVNFMSQGSTNAFDYNCNEWPTEAKAAFNYALSIWADLLGYSTTIHLEACWSPDFSGNVLGSAGSYFASYDIDGTSVNIPIHLMEEFLSNDNLYSLPDIIAQFSANRTDWYFGTDANPSSGEVDFVSTVLHEIGHGLGFSGSAKVNDGIGELSNTPYIYDLFVDLPNGNPITSLANPSTALANALQGGSTANLKFDDSNLNTYRQTIDLYTPATFNGGSSYSHFDEGGSTTNEMMSPFIAAGQAIHEPGLALLVLQEMGIPLSTLPVELVDFQAKLYDKEILLKWETRSETNNDYFSIEKSMDGITFIEIGKVKGKGNTRARHTYSFEDKNLFHRNNYYRLRQVDFDGDYYYSDVRYIEIAKPIEGIVISPNPTDGIITCQAGVNDTKELIMEIFNMEGRLLKSEVIFPFHNQSISMQEFNRGSYIIHLKSENFFYTKRIIKL